MRVLLTGASGQLGAYLLKELGASGWETIGWRGTTPAGTERTGQPRLLPVDLEDSQQAVGAFRAADARLVIHAAGMTRVGDCVREPDRAERINAGSTALLAELARQFGARLVYVSTDLVFNGEKGSYREEDEARPLSVYGRSKLQGEAAALSAGDAAVVRVSLLFGPSRSGRPSFFDQQCSALRSGEPVTLFEDEWRTPLSLRRAAAGLLAIASSEFRGVVHLGGPERMSRLEMGQRLARWLGIESPAIQVTSRMAIAADEPRPRDTSLDSSRFRSLFVDFHYPTFEEALEEMSQA